MVLFKYDGTGGINLNDILFLGPLLVPVRLLLLGVAALAGYAALRYRLHRIDADADQRKRILDPLGHVSFAGLLIWKFSPLVLDTRFVLEHPLSLLYYSGGNRGLLLAAIYAAAALGYKTWKNKLPALLFPDGALTFALAAGGVYGLLLVIVGNGGLFAAIASAAGFILYYAQIRHKQPPGGRESGNLITAAIVLGLLLGIVQGMVQTDRSAVPGPPGVGVRVGDIAADFTLTSLEGKPVQLSDYRGKNVLINFWATWCPPCKAEMPHVEKFFQEAQQQGVAVIGVNLTNTESSADRVNRFVQQQQLTFPIVLDSSGQVGDLYRVRAYPTSIVIDSSGTIRGKFQGAVSYDRLRKTFRDIR